MTFGQPRKPQFCGGPLKITANTSHEQHPVNHFNSVATRLSMTARENVRPQVLYDCQYMVTIMSHTTPRVENMVSSQVPIEAPPTPNFGEGAIGALVDSFKLLADETRLRIVCILLEEHELNVRTLCGILSQSQPAVSHHLALLRTAGVIECRRDGKHNFYHLMPQRFNEINDLLTRMALVGASPVDVAPHVAAPASQPPSA